MIWHKEKSNIKTVVKAEKLTLQRFFYSYINLIQDSNRIFIVIAERFEAPIL